MRELIDLTQAAHHLPLVIGAGWLVRVPLLNREEGHEAITRAAWDGLALTGSQQRALIRGVRAPDIGFLGLVTSVLPFAQRRHALRAWSGQTTAAAVHDVREFIAAAHARALALPEGRGAGHASARCCTACRIPTLRPTWIGSTAGSSA